MPSTKILENIIALRYAPLASPVFTGTPQLPTGTQLASPLIQTPTVSGSMAGDGIPQYAEVTVTATQVKALAATPKAIIATPGAGKILQILGGEILLDYGTTQFAEDAGGSNLALKYTDGSGVQASEEIEMTGFITQAGDYSTSIIPKADMIIAKAGVENQGLVLHNVGAGEIVTGDSVLKVKVVYVVWTTAF